MEISRRVRDSRVITLTSERNLNQLLALISGAGNGRHVKSQSHQRMIVVAESARNENVWSRDLSFGAESDWTDNHSIIV